MKSYEIENIEMRKVYSSTLKSMIDEDKRVFVLEADLAEAISTNLLSQTKVKNYNVKLWNYGSQYDRSSKWTLTNWKYSFCSYYI